MEAALALLLPLIGGNLFVRGYTALRYKAAREDGHRLYFRVAYHGVVLFLVALALVVLLHLALAGWPWFVSVRDAAVGGIAPLLKEPKNAGAQAAFLLACVLSVFLGRFSPWLLNLAFKSRHEEALWEAAAEDELEQFLLEALALFKTIAVTLTSGKVYVGYVLTTPEPRTDRRVITLLPLMSGYRQDEGGKVVFTTFYDQFYREDADPGMDSEDFKLLLPIDKMSSLSFFDVAVYAAFNVGTPDEPEPPPRRVKVASSWRRRDTGPAG